MGKAKVYKTVFGIYFALMFLALFTIFAITKDSGFLALISFFSVINTCFVYIAFVKPFIRTIDILEHKEENNRKESQEKIINKETEFAALQNQINPHFLYNTLDSIRGQALLDDNIEIADMVEALSSFFRYSISKKGSLVTLRDEINNIENYMKIQQYRFNNRFSLEVTIDEKEIWYCMIPKLIIQPIIENAILHGLEDTVFDGKVRIGVMRTYRQLIIKVSDNGKGMPLEKLKEINNRLNEDKQFYSYNSGTGIALTNINNRIKLLFGNAYGIKVYSILNSGTDIEINVPYDYPDVRGYREVGKENEK